MSDRDSLVERLLEAAREESVVQPMQDAREEQAQCLECGEWWDGDHREGCATGLLLEAAGEIAGLEVWRARGLYFEHLVRCRHCDIYGGSCAEGNALLGEWGELQEAHTNTHNQRTASAPGTVQP